MISLALGVLGGGLALYILRIGLFLTGATLGLALALGIETVLSMLSPNIREHSAPSATFSVHSVSFLSFF